jgi:hypothetical protein
MARKKLTEERFFEECDQAHGAYFGDLMARWHEVGHKIRMQASSAALVIGNTTLCSLYPSYRNLRSEKSGLKAWRRMCGPLRDSRRGPAARKSSFGGRPRRARTLRRLSSN